MKKVVNIIAWVVSVTVLFIDVCMTIVAPVTGIAFILIGLILLPPLYRVLRDWASTSLKFDIKLWQKAIAIVALFVISVAFIPLPDGGFVIPGGGLVPFGGLGGLGGFVLG